MKAVLALLAILIALASSGCAEGQVQVRPQTDADTVKYSRQGYEALFTVGVLHDIEIVISAAEWRGLLQDMADYAQDDPDGRPMTGNYRKATFVYRGTAGDAVIEEVGFRTKGHLNRPYPQDQFGNLHRAHFKIKFNKAFDQTEGTPEYETRNQRRFAKLRELELRMNTNNASEGAWDTSQMREFYGYELMRRAGVNASRVGSARLWIVIGGVRHYFGIFTLIEPVDKSFLTKRYGSAANDGNLYKCAWSASGPANLGPIDDPNGFEHPLAGDPRILGVKDWQSHYRPTYDLKTNTDQPDHIVFLDFVRNLDTLDGEALKEYLDASFEIDRFLRYLAINVLIGKWDDYWAIGNNYFLYFNNDGKVEYYPTDLDMAFGEGFALFDTHTVGIYEWGNRTRELIKLFNPDADEDWLDENAELDYPLVEKVFEIEEYRQTYEHYLTEFMKPENKLFTFSEYERMFNKMHSLYSPYLDNDMDEGDSMYLGDGARTYYRARTLSIVEELGLDAADYDVPAEKDWLVNPANGHYYRLTRPMNWTQAEAQAVAWGGHLVTVNNRKEERWLREQFGTQEPFWLGFNDLAVEGNWKWTSGEPVTYTNWASGQPDDYKEIEDAAHMNWSGAGQDGDGWNDAPMAGRYRAIVESTAEAGSLPTAHSEEGNEGKVLTAFVPTGELSFTATEYTHPREGFSLQRPRDWRNTTNTQLYEVIAPNQTTGLFVSSWTSRAQGLVEAVIGTLREGPVLVIGSGETALSDGTPAEITEYHATIVGYPMHCYSIGVKRDGTWLTVNLWNIDQYSPFDRGLFEEIAHTLHLD